MPLDVPDGHAAAELFECITGHGILNGLANLAGLNCAGRSKRDPRQVQAIVAARRSSGADGGRASEATVVGLHAPSASLFRGGGFIDVSDAVSNRESARPLLSPWRG